MKMCLIDSAGLREQIVLKGYSQNGFSYNINVTHRYLSRVLNGEVDPSPAVAKKISDGVDAKISDIFLHLMVAKVIQENNLRR